MLTASRELGWFAAIRCHIASASEGLIDWRDAWSMMKRDTRQAIGEIWARARSLPVRRRVRKLKKAWAKALLS